MTALKKEFKGFKITGERINVFGWGIAFFIALVFGLASSGVIAFVCGVFGFIAVRKAVDSYLTSV